MSLTRNPLLCLKFLGTFLLLYFSPHATANADEQLSAPNWRHIDVAYGTEHDRNSSVRAEVFNLRGSMPLSTYGLLLAEFNSGSVSGHTNTPELNPYQLSILAGLRMAASEHADLFVLLGPTQVKVEVDAFTYSETGVLSQAGVRGRVSPQLELTSLIQYSKTGDIGTTSWHGEVRYNVTSRIDILIGGSIYSRALGGKLGISMHF